MEIAIYILATACIIGLAVMLIGVTWDYARMMYRRFKNNQE